MAHHGREARALSAPRGGRRAGRRVPGGRRTRLQVNGFAGRAQARRDIVRPDGGLAARSRDRPGCLRGGAARPARPGRALEALARRGGPAARAGAGRVARRQPRLAGARGPALRSGATAFTLRITGTWSVLFAGLLSGFLGGALARACPGRRARWWRSWPGSSRCRPPPRAAGSDAAHGEPVALALAVPSLAPRPPRPLARVVAARRRPGRALSLPGRPSTRWSGPWRSTRAARGRAPRRPASSSAGLRVPRQDRPRT